VPTAHTYVSETTGEVVIDCIANSDMSKGPEVPLWHCPCAECTRLDWDAMDDDMQADYGRLGLYRHAGFPEYWDDRGRPCNAHPYPVCTSDDPTNHQGDTCPVHEALRVEPVVISAEFLYQQEGGEPVWFAVVNDEDEVISVWPSQAMAEDALAFTN
jgi:hypothetical protein